MKLPVSFQFKQRMSLEMIRLFFFFFQYFFFIQTLDHHYSKDDHFRADFQLIKLEVSVPNGTINYGYSEIFLRAVTEGRKRFTLFFDEELNDLQSIKIYSDWSSKEFSEVPESSERKELQKSVDKDLIYSKVTVSLIESSVSEKITAVIEWRSNLKTQSLESSFTEGRNSFVTSFDSFLIKKWIPHLNSPFYRTQFQIKIKPVSQKGKSPTFKVVSNTPLITEKDGFHVFKTTPQQLMPYQIGFSILDADDFRETVTGEYFDVPIVFYATPEFVLGPKDAGTMVNAVIYALTFCEGNFNVPLGWPKLDFVLAESKTILATHRPGMLVLKKKQSLEELVQSVVDSVVHQWTSVKVPNSDWTGLWVTEGVNEFVKRAILFDLVTYGRVGVSAYKLDEVLFFYANGRLGEPNSEESWQKLGARVIHNDPEFFIHAGNTMALMDKALNGHLITCFSSLMTATSYSYFDTHSILDHFSNCPFGPDLNATEFLAFWLFDTRTPVLEINIPGDGSSYDVINFSLNFTCMPREAQEGKVFCAREADANHAMHFAVSIHDTNGKIIEATEYYSGENVSSIFKSRFVFNQNNQPFYANVESRGSFLIKYPDFNYEQFFKWFENEMWTYREWGELSFQADVYPAHIIFFIFDMFELSRRGEIHAKWFFSLFDQVKNFKKIGLYDRPEFNRLWLFETYCLGSYMEKYLTNKYNNEDLLYGYFSYICYVANDPPDHMIPPYNTSNLIKDCKFPLRFEDWSVNHLSSCRIWADNYFHLLMPFFLSDINGWWVEGRAFPLQMDINYDD